jgi:hypothetical protein
MAEFGNLGTGAKSILTAMFPRTYCSFSYYYRNILPCERFDRKMLPVGQFF